MEKMKKMKWLPTSLCKAIAGRLFKEQMCDIGCSVQREAFFNFPDENKNFVLSNLGFEKGTRIETLFTRIFENDFLLVSGLIFQRKSIKFHKFCLNKYV